jgi:hypothetical protein
MTKHITTAFFFFFFSFGLNAQLSQSYTSFIQQDTAIRWAAECDKVINLTPKVQEHSLKKWYLDKLKKNSVTAYRMNNDMRSVSSYKISIPELQTQEWLKGTGIELSASKYPQEWYFFDTTLPVDDYNRYKARVRNLNLAADSCCGCDEADAFRARQVLTYKNGQFSIYNVFISPLCARKTEQPPADWYPLCNVAFNDSPFEKRATSSDMVLLNTNGLDYNFSISGKGKYDSVLTVHRPSLISVLLQDLYNGKIKATDYETGETISEKDFLTWKMSADTVPVYDIADPSKYVRHEVVKISRNPDQLDHIRIVQEHWFDFKKEKLYSVVKEVMIMEEIYSRDGKKIIGWKPFCRLL